VKDIKIWFASSEAAPFAKTGGLADVAGSLPKALRKLGADVRVVMPKYRQIPPEYADRMKFLGYTMVDLTWRKQYCGVFSLEHEGVTWYFLDNEYYFFRDWYYGMYDDGERFAFFSKAVLEALPLIGFKPDIIHLNDWQTGLVSVLLDAHYRDYRWNGFYKKIHTVFTIHNLKYQGIFPKQIMDDVIGLDWRFFGQDGIEFYDDVNYLKAGLAYSTVLTTVSKTYAEEIRHDFFGENLQGLISKRSADLYGIVNGIDYERNDPENDERLYKTYSVNNIEGKYENKKRLQEDCGLDVKTDTPLIGIISRLVQQKGFDLIEYMMSELMDLGLQIIVLGTGDRRYEDYFRWAQSRYPGRVSANICYDPVLAQRIYAGSDMFLMPSLFEPCGLSQLFSMRYGTVPIVRETGGLKDTVIPYNMYTGEGTGFTFANYNAHEMKDAAARAIGVYRDRDKWMKLMKNCMSQDFSWDRSAMQYIQLYNMILDRYGS
jgi:starch synthase